MHVVTNTHLKYIDLILLENWSVQGLLDAQFNYSNKYEQARIGDFLIKSRNIVNIEDDKEYNRVTVKINNNGVILRDTEKGVNIGTKKQYRANAGQFIISKIDARNGAFGIIPSELEHAIVTNDFPLFDVNTKKINPQFLLLITTTKVFIKFAQSCSSGTTNRQRMDIDIFLNQKIPLPKLEEQAKIVTNNLNKVNEAERLKNEAEDLEGKIEKYIFEQLGITEKATRVYSKKIRIIDYFNIERWGIEFNLGSKSSQLLESTKYKNKPLKEVVQINPTTPLPKQSLTISFLPMECVSDEFGEVMELREKQSNDAKGYTKFKEGDLVWARITPCMQNGKSAIVKNLKNSLGCGSTEYHVIRNTNPDIDLEYIYHLLRLKTVLAKAMSHFTGSSGQQRVPKYFLEELLIPVPEYKVQKLISNKVNAMKLQKKEFKEKAENLKNEAKQEFEKAIFNS